MMIIIDVKMIYIYIAIYKKNHFLYIRNGINLLIWKLWN